MFRFLFARFRRFSSSFSCSPLDNVISSIRNTVFCTAFYASTNSKRKLQCGFVLYFVQLPFSSLFILPHTHTHSQCSKSVLLLCVCARTRLACHRFHFHSGSSSSENERAVHRLFRVGRARLCHHCQQLKYVCDYFDATQFSLLFSVLVSQSQPLSSLPSSPSSYSFSIFMKALFNSFGLFSKYIMAHERHSNNLNVLCLLERIAANVNIKANDDNGDRSKRMNFSLKHKTKEMKKKLATTKMKTHRKWQRKRYRKICATISQLKLSFFFGFQSEIDPIMSESSPNCASRIISSNRQVLQDCRTKRNVER